MDTVKITIDGREIDAIKDRTVIQAAQEAGIEIPHYCYHPKLSIAGNCRMCLVEIEKIPKLQIACNTRVQEGMVVKSQSPHVLAARRGVLEFLLINHPLDCPICDQAGECWLQNYYMEHSLEASRFIERKEAERKRQPFGPNVVFDAERCIKCTRCIRFLDEITHTHELTVLNRSDDSTIALFPGKTLDNPLAANVNDICPVGALTDRDFRFKARVWFLKSTPSVCPGCSTGCNINIETYRNRIARFKPRVNEAVNSHWICDEGRYCFHELTQGERLSSPLIRQEGGLLVPADWDSAIQAALKGLTGSSEGLAGLLSARNTNEEAFLFTKLMRALSPSATMEVAYREKTLTDVERILKSPDGSPNFRGIREMGAGTPSGWEDWCEKLIQGNLRALYLVGEDLLSSSSDREGIQRALKNLSFLVVQDTTLNATAELAHVVFPSTHFGEKEGTYTNRRGRVQRLRAACLAPAGAVPDLEIFSRILAASGSPQRSVKPAEIFQDIAAEIPRYRDLTYESVGESGVEPV